MAAYLIAHIIAKNAEKLTEYRSRVPVTLAPWEGELVLRGKLVTVLSGQRNHTDTVVIRFPNPEFVDKWRTSDAYQQLIPVPTQAAEMDVISYELVS